MCSFKSLKVNVFAYVIKGEPGDTHRRSGKIPSQRKSDNTLIYDVIAHMAKKLYLKLEKQTHLRLRINIFKDL